MYVSKLGCFILPGRNKRIDNAVAMLRSRLDVHVICARKLPAHLFNCNEGVLSEQQVSNVYWTIPEVYYTL